MQHLRNREQSRCQVLLWLRRYVDPAEDRRDDARSSDGHVPATGDRSGRAARTRRRVCRQPKSARRKRRRRSAAGGHRQRDAQAEHGDGRTGAGIDCGGDRRLFRLSGRDDARTLVDRGLFGDVGATGQIHRTPAATRDKQGVAEPTPSEVASPAPLPPTRPAMSETAPPAALAPKVTAPPAPVAPKKSSAPSGAKPASPGKSAAAPRRTAPKAPLTSPPTSPDPEPLPPPAPVTAAAPAPPPQPDRWQEMSDALARCGQESFIGRVVCEQRVRLRYCDGYWGKVAQCPDAQNPNPGR
jgi:hypothetical protein